MAEFALVGSNVVYGKGVGTGANTALVPGDLDAGSIGAYAFDPADNKYKLVVAGAAGSGQITAVDIGSKDVTFFLGVGNGDVSQSESHQIKGFREYKKIAYAAPVAQVIDIGSNGTTGNLDVPTLINQGFTDALIRIKEVTPGNTDYGNTYYVDGGRILQSDTDDTVADKLVAEINNNPSLSVHFTAAKNSQSTNRGVKITANKAGVSYEVSIGGVIELGPIHYTTASFVGAGTSADIAQKEQLDNIYRGDFYGFDGPAYKIYKGTSQVNPAGQYVTYWLRSVNESADKTGQKATVDHEVKTWLAVPTGASQISDLDSILASLKNAGRGPQGPQGPQGA